MKLQPIKLDSHDPGGFTYWNFWRVWNIWMIEEGVQDDPSTWEYYDDEQQAKDAWTARTGKELT